MLRIGFTNLNLTQPTTRFAFPYNILRDPSTLCVHDREIPQPSLHSLQLHHTAVEITGLLSCVSCLSPNR